VWWLKLGLELQRIQPGKPQQNGRQERVHLTLEEVVSAPAANPRLQQRALDVWRHEYNSVRPHEALAMKTPERVYQPSRRHYPCKLISEPFFHEPFEHTRLDHSGRLRWSRGWIHISTALRMEIVEVMPRDDFTHFDVFFGPIHLGVFDSHRLDRGLRIPRRRRLRSGQPSKMSLD
jgi:hypothetical protein